LITSTLRMVFTEPARDEALRVLRTLWGPVRSHPGCLATRLMRDDQDERILTWVEHWHSREDHERHVRSDAFRRLLAVMDLAAEPPLLEVDEVEHRQGFEIVEQLRGAAPLVSPNVDSNPSRGEKEEAGTKP
jgi:quinol monooxygenase YgiN